MIYQLKFFFIFLIKNCLQATDCVPLAHVELQNVLEPFTAASCNASARFGLLLVLPDFGENWSILTENSE
jgi:hypothetical protein